jgi:hypothetical protein
MKNPPEMLKEAYRKILWILGDESRNHTDHIRLIQQNANVADVEPDQAVDIAIQAANIRQLEMIAMLLADLLAVPYSRPDPDPEPDPDLYDRDAFN